MDLFRSFDFTFSKVEKEEGARLFSSPSVKRGGAARPIDKGDEFVFFSIFLSSFDGSARPVAFGETEGNDEGDEGEG